MVGTNKLPAEKLRRVVVVSPREVPPLPVSWPFEILIFRYFLKALTVFRTWSFRKSVRTLIVSVNRIPGGWSQIISDLDDPRGGTTPWTIVRLKPHEKTKLGAVLLPAPSCCFESPCVSPSSHHRVTIDAQSNLRRRSITFAVSWIS